MNRRENDNLYRLVIGGTYRRMTPTFDSGSIFSEVDVVVSDPTGEYNRLKERE